MSKKERLTIPKIRELKKAGHKIAMITVYDYPMALQVENSEAEMILVGDSLGMVILGHAGTVNVTLRDIIYHLKAVRAAAPNTFVIGDMPFLSYQVSVEEAVRNAGMLIQAGADCVKMEGGVEIAPTVERVVKAGIPVMGHIGLTPQSAAALGGFKVQGKSAETAKKLLQDAKALEEAGAFSIVVECVPVQVTKLIYERTNMTLISTGSGPYADGFNLNAYDLIGMFDRFKPKFVKQYCQIGVQIRQAFDEFARDCAAGLYPAPEHCFNISEDELTKINTEVGHTGNSSKTF